MRTGDSSQAKPMTSHPEFYFSGLRLRNSESFARIIKGIDLQFTYDGRGALFQLFSSLRSAGRTAVLLPAFHCPTVVEPAIRAGLVPRFYRIRGDLSIDHGDFQRCLDKNIAAALVINYFGFPANAGNLRAACRENQTPLIEDCAHSFLDADPLRLAGEESDMAIYSFKKIVPSYVGGGIRYNSHRAGAGVRLARPPLKDSVVNVKRIVDQGISSSNSRVLHRLRAFTDAQYNRYKHRYDDGEAGSATVQDDTTGLYPFFPRLARARIPWYAKYILRTADLDSIVLARQRNYEFLRSRVAAVAKIDIALPNSIRGVCPWGFPVIIRNRSETDWKLRSNGVPLFTFGETLHPSLFSDRVANKKTTRDALELSTSILCLSIHQGISLDSLDQVANCIDHVLSVS
jgi:dTDP-4-amino-4,6-dideoxygalactose transaminase